LGIYFYGPAGVAEISRVSRQARLLRRFMMD
jgi:hypothetical protein